MNEAFVAVFVVVPVGWALLWLIGRLVEPHISTQHTKRERLIEEHNNQSHAENMERRRFIESNWGKMTPEKWTVYHEMKRRHNEAWQARVDKIVGK